MPQPGWISKALKEVPRLYYSDWAAGSWKDAVRIFLRGKCSNLEVSLAISVYIIRVLYLWFVFWLLENHKFLRAMNNKVIDYD